MKLFSIDSPLYKFFSRLWDIIQLNFLWLICSLPIVTFGASTAAAFSVTLKMIDDAEGYVAPAFFKAFHANLKKGIPIGLIFLVCGYGLYLYTQVYLIVEDYRIILLILGIIAALVFFLTFLYAFPLLARYENGIFQTLGNSYRIATRFFLKTLMLVVLIALETALFMWNKILIIIGLLIAPACIMLTISGFAMQFFRAIEKEPGSVSNPESLEDSSAGEA